MPATLQDIAGKLNVSRSLVSGVLNDRPNVWASPETRERILAAAREFNYRPSSSARALRSGRTMQIAAVVGERAWSQFEPGGDTASQGFIEATAAQNYRVLTLPPLAEDEDHPAEALGLGHSDGFVLFADHMPEGVYDFLCEREVPFVVIGNPGNAQLPQVDQDNNTQIRDSLRWMSAQGHQRILMAHPLMKPSQQPTHVRVVNSAYRKTMEEIGSGFDVVITPLQEFDLAMLRALIQEHSPTAVLTRAMTSALQWRAAFEAEGKRVPEDALVLAHMNIGEYSHLKQCGLEKGLACNIHNPHEAGRRAGEMLLSLLGGHAPPTKPLLLPGSGPHWCNESKTVI